MWVDHFGILGLGKNVPIAMGNVSDSILPFVDGKFVTLRPHRQPGDRLEGPRHLDDFRHAGGRRYSCRCGRIP